MSEVARFNPAGIKQYLKGLVVPPQETWVAKREREAGLQAGQVPPAALVVAPSVPEKDLRVAPAVPEKDLHAAPAVRGIKGFSNAGLIPGKVNPNVADDVTIDAKKGEYVLPVEVVGAMGGAGALDAMVRNIKTKMGMPAETGPKLRSEPDAQGRMNARGMRGFAGGGAVNPDKMYTGNGPLSQFLRRFRNNPATPAGVPTGYDRAMNIADTVGATLKSWGREAQPELAGTDSEFTNKGGVFNTDVVGGIKRWDAKQRNPDAVTATHDNLNLSSDFAVAPPVVPTPPAPVATEPVTMDWTKAGADAIKAVGGFGKQPVGEVVASPEDEASRLAARNTQFAATAADAAGTDAREAFGAQVAKERTAVANTAATKDRIGLLNSIISNNGRPEYVQAARLELASILGQQQVGLKEAEISAGLEKENVKGEFGLKEQALRNAGVVEAENVRGSYGFKSAKEVRAAQKDLSLEQEKLRQAGNLEVAKERSRGAMGAAEAKKMEKETAEEKALAEAEVAYAVEQAGLTGKSPEEALRRIRAGQTVDNQGTWYGGKGKKIWTNPPSKKIVATRVVNGVKQVKYSDGTISAQ